MSFIDKLKKNYLSFEDPKFSMDVSRISLDDNYISNQEPLIKKALRNLDLIESGGIANPNENRMVGHYWLRSPELSPNIEIKNSILDNVKKIKDFSSKVHKGEILNQNNEKFKYILLVGIGGSALGPQLLDDSFSSEKDPLKIFFIDNTDPVGINKTISSIPDISKTLAIIVSKSGGTKETRNGMKILESIWLKQKLDISKSFIAITGNNSKLFQHAKEHNWLEIFPIWDWVGGRTSLWSSVGLLPASLQGFDIEQLLAGASKMDELTRNQDCYNNPSMMMALVSLYCTNAKGEKDLIVIPYRDSLKLLSKYLQQLIMESLGKEKDLDGKIVNQGINVFGNKGSTDQHAYVQQLRDGLNNFYVAFIETKKKTNLDFDDVNMKVEEDFTSEDYLKGFSLGTKLALSDNNRKSLSIFLDEFSIYDFGSLLAFFERFVGFYAAMVNINAYDQPGVEAGKKAADRMLVLKKEVLNSITNKKKTLLTQLLSDFSNDYQESEVFEILNYLERNNIINSNRAQNLNEKEFFI